MGEIFVVVEHRQDRIREIAFQMLWKGADLCEAGAHILNAVVIGGGEELPEEIRDRADRVIAVQGEDLATFDGEIYAGVLTDLLAEYRPLLTLMGHTPWGMDFAPALAVKTGLPLVTD
ncbi:MAG: hypothetical protein JW821_12595, partial [Deltaproteobacteria bacterium]|nr:hypothetical protein [Deltaproteobacteria bacterium]